jgi:hypothetical protein
MPIETAILHAVVVANFAMIDPPHTAVFFFDNQPRGCISLFLDGSMSRQVPTTKPLTTALAV